MEENRLSDPRDELCDEYESKYRDDKRHGGSGNGTRSARAKHDAVCVTLCLGSAPYKK